MPCDFCCSTPQIQNDKKINTNYRIYCIIYSYFVLASEHHLVRQYIQLVRYCYYYFVIYKGAVFFIPQGAR